MLPPLLLQPPRTEHPLPFVQGAILGMRLVTPNCYCHCLLNESRALVVDLTVVPEDRRMQTRLPRRSWHQLMQQERQ